MTRLDLECKAQGGASDGSKVHIIEISWIMKGRGLTAHRDRLFGVRTESKGKWLKNSERKISSTRFLV